MSKRHRRTGDRDLYIPDIVVDPYVYIEAEAVKYDAFIPGLGNVLRVGWQILAPHLFHTVGHELAATSGAATELDYYTDGGHQ